MGSRLKETRRGESTAREGNAFNIGLM